MDVELKDRTLQDLRTIDEKVKEKAHSTQKDSPDLLELRRIVENRIADWKRTPTHFLLPKPPDCRSSRLSIFP